jgi:hypothetical protein
MTCEQGRCRAERIRGVVGDAVAAMVEEADETFQRLSIVHSLGGFRAAGELSALGDHPGVKIRHDGRAEALADNAALVGRLTVDPPLDVEQGVNAPDRFHRHGRNSGRRLGASLAPGAGLEVIATVSCPAQGRRLRGVA